MEKKSLRTHGIAVREGLTARIVLDRSAMNFPAFQLRDTEGDVGKHDYRWLLSNLDTIAHELAHVLYYTEDDTPEHFARTAQLSREIAQLY